MSTTDSRTLRTLLAILGIATAAVYWPTVHQDFAVLDDGEYVVDNPWVNGGISWPAVRWAFASFYASNWHPLTWLSHQADWSLYGSFAGGHHLTNLLLHTVNTLLLFLLLRDLTGRTGRSWVVAALFGWHPLHVESVAWIAERKDLLSTLCLLGSVWAYSRYARTREADLQAAPSDGLQSGAWKYYGLALGGFAVGLMCKPMLVTLPCLLLLLDFWPLERCILSTAAARAKWGSLVVEKLPFFALSAGACLVTLAAQGAGGAVKSVEQVPLVLRALNALSAYGVYVRQTLWPHPLCIFYPLPQTLPLAGALVGAVLLGGVGVVMVLYGRRCPWLVSGVLWFVGSLVPVIGLVQVGAQAHADRYMYIPSVGLFMALVWTTHQLLKSGSKPAIALAVASLLACLGITHQQLGYWQDNVKLYTHALAHTRNNPQAQINLGVALANLGRTQEAMDHYREAIRLQPNSAAAHCNLGLRLVDAGQIEEAVREFSETLRYSPHNEVVLNHLGAALAQQGKYKEALVQFQEAIRANPGHAKSYSNAGAALQALGQAGAAVTNYCRALQLKPNAIETLDRLAFLLATCPGEAYHQPEQAIQLAQRVSAITQDQIAYYLGTLALAYASAGQYSNAIIADEKGLRICQAHGMPELTAKLEKDLAAYRAFRFPERDWKQGR